MFKLKAIIIKKILTVLIVMLFFVICVTTGNAQADDVTITNQNENSKPPQPVVSNDKTKPNTSTSQFIPYASLSDNNVKLFKASLEGNIQDVQVALAEGADVNVKDTMGNTALMLASANKDHANEIIKLLLDKGADINAKDNYGGTALMWASSADNKHADEIVKLLLDKGADINAKNNYGKTALMLASFHGNTKIVEILSKAGAKE